jgi:chromosomal replication initiation ATPase DnaA
MNKPRVIMRKQDRIDYVVDGICEYYGIDSNEFLRRARTDRRYKRKRIAIKILRDIADCSFKDIKYAFDNKSEANIWYIYDGITEDLNSGNGCKMEVKKEYADIVKFLGV